MLRVQSTADAKMFFRGTTIEVPEVVTRIAFSGASSGKTIEVVQEVYESFESYQQGMNMMDIQGLELSKWFELELATDPITYELQTIQVAHEKMKNHLEGLGFLVVIFGLA